jgi:hypothetical protein
MSTHLCRVSDSRVGTLARQPLELSVDLRINHPTSYIDSQFFLAAMQVFSRRTAGVLQAAARKQGYSTATSGYAATAENLRINKDTKVIYQGFTGKQGRCAMDILLIGLSDDCAAFTPNKPLTTVLSTEILQQQAILTLDRNPSCWRYKS